jgi:hypothetical protein
MSEDIRSMLTNRAKVSPRNSALKLGKSKFDEEDAMSEVSSPMTLQVGEPFSPILDPRAVGEVADGSPNSDSQELAKEGETTLFPSSDLRSEDGSLKKIEAELEKLPQVGKRLAIHLEQKVRADLLNLCDRQEITPEVFLEATFVILQNQENLLEEIVTDAKERLAARKKAGFLRRTISMIGKIG